MSLDGISRELVWVLTLRLVARGRATLHGTGHVADAGCDVLVDLIDHRADVRPDPPLVHGKRIIPGLSELPGIP